MNRPGRYHLTFPTQAQRPLPHRVTRCNFPVPDQLISPIFTCCGAPAFFFVIPCPFSTPRPRYCRAETREGTGFGLIRPDTAIGTPTCPSGIIRAIILPGEPGRDPSSFFASPLPMFNAGLKMALVMCDLSHPPNMCYIPDAACLTTTPPPPTHSPAFAKSEERLRWGRGRG